MAKNSILRAIVFVTILIAIAVNIYGRKKSDIAAHEIPRGYSFNTSDIAPDVKGFGGHIEMLVALDKDGSIKDIRVLGHSETPEYAAGITQPEFLGQFKGKSAEDDFIVGKDVDAITHATISSKAVAGILKASLERVSSQKRVAAALDLNLDFYITVLIITFLLIAFYLKKAWLRYIGLLASIIYFGFLRANFISMSNLGAIFLWSAPEVGPNMAWYVFILSGLVLTFLLEKFYCSYMCPFGGIQVFLNKIFRFNIEITPALEDRLRKIKFFLLWIFIVLILVLNNAALANYEPFSTVFLRSGTALSWSIALMILLLSLFHNRPFCNYFCAAGGFLEILSNLGRRIFRRNERKGDR